MAALLFIIVALPFSIATGILRNASEDDSKRKNIKKNIIIFIIPAIYVCLIERNVFLEEAFFSFKQISDIFSEASVSLLTYSSLMYMSVQFLMIGFTNHYGNFNLFKLIFFTFLFYSACIYGLSHLDHFIFGHQIIIIMIIAGLLYFCFIAGIHAVFPKIIIAANVYGFFQSYHQQGKLFVDDYFIILDFIPETQGIIGVTIVILSIFCSAYSFGVEKGWFEHIW